MLNNMKTLLGLVLLLLGFVYYLVNKNSNESTVGTGDFLLPALQKNESVSELSRIIISKATDQLTLIKQEDDWFIEGGFYADTGPMMQLLQALKSAKKIEAKTSNPENFNQLSLKDDDLKVTLMAGDQTLAAVHLGKKSSAPGASFARLAGETQTWLVTAIDAVAYLPDDWVLKTVLDHGAEDVAQVKIDNGSASMIEINRNLDDGSWQLANIPAGKQVKDDVPWIQLASGLSRFSIDEALPLELTDKALKITAEYQLTTGARITVKLYQHAADYFATISSGKYKGWMFKVPAYKFEALNQSMDALLEDATLNSNTDGEETVTSDDSDAQ